MICCFEDDYETVIPDQRRNNERQDTQFLHRMIQLISAKKQDM